MEFGAHCLSLTSKADNIPTIMKKLGPKTAQKYYENPTELFYIFLNLDKNEINSLDWNQYKEFNPETIMKKFTYSAN
jgi:hypothetical protein